MMSTVLGLIFVSTAFAKGGDWVGNGGAGLQCDGSAQIELLDYQEGRTQRHLSVDMAAPGASVDENVMAVLNRLRVVDTSRAERYLNWYRHFFDEVTWIEDGSILPVGDTGPVILPAGCRVRQIAIQRPDTEMLPGDTRYMIDKKVWNMMSNQGRAGLILHEIIYREGIEEGQVTSTRIRYFNQMISSSEIAGYSSLKMLALIRLVGFSKADYRGLVIDLKSAEYHNNGMVKSSLVIFGSLLNDGQSLNLAGRRVSFDDEGHLESISMSRRENFLWKVGGQSLQVTACDDGLVYFHPTGALKQGVLISPYFFMNEEFNVRVIGQAAFAMDGTLVSKTVQVQEPSQAFVFGEWRSFLGTANLSEKGNAKSLYFRDTQNVVIGDLRVLGWHSVPAICTSSEFGTFRATLSIYLFGARVAKQGGWQSIFQWAIPEDATIPMILWPGQGDALTLNQNNFKSAQGHVAVTCSELE